MTAFITLFKTKFLEKTCFDLSHTKVAKRKFGPTFRHRGGDNYISNNNNNKYEYFIFVFAKTSWYTQYSER